MTKDENEDDDVSMWNVDLKCINCEWTGIMKHTRINAKPEDKTISVSCPRCYATDNFEVISEE